MKKYIKSSTASQDSLRRYIDLLTDPKYDEGQASWVSYRDGVANFWYDADNDGYVLAIQNEDEYDPDTYKYNHPTYWCDEELIDVNDIRLTADELYSELINLPGADLSNYYGLRAIFDDYPELSEV